MRAVFIEIPGTGADVIRTGLARVADGDVLLTSQTYEAVRREWGDVVESAAVTAYVREPWERVLSLFWKRSGATKRSDFHTFVESLERQGIPERSDFCPQTTWIRRSELTVNPVQLFRWERFSEMYPDLCRVLGVQRRSLHNTHWDHPADWRLWYNWATFERVANLYAEDVKMLGYAPWMTNPAPKALKLEPAKDPQPESAPAPLETKLPAKQTTKQTRKGSSSSTRKTRTRTHKEQ